MAKAEGKRSAPGSHQARDFEAKQRQRRQSIADRHLKQIRAILAGYDLLAQSTRGNR